MSGTNADEVTRLLAAWRCGDAQAPAELARLVYAELRGMAARRLAGARGLPLQTTELVNEAFERLLEKPLAAQDRQHFFRTAALALRQVLVDTIRREQAEKRGGGVLNLSLGAADDVAIAGPETWLGVEAALRQLEAESERKCRVVELSCLFGLSQQEIADCLGVSLPTIERDLRFARAWLKDRLAA
jgi:RNA polymerase sigma factor (TIGR02999 family)